MLRHVCSNLENILKIRWDQEKWCSVNYATKRIAKEDVSCHCTQIWKTFLKLTEFGRRRFSSATDTSPG